MESELDRSRVELSSLRLQARDVDDSGKAGFEVEKLLSALKTTVDQMSATSTSNLSLKNSSDVTTKSVGETNLSDRVDGAVKRLGDIRSWMREDAKVFLYLNIIISLHYVICNLLS